MNQDKTMWVRAFVHRPQMPNGRLSLSAGDANGYLVCLVVNRYKMQIYDDLVEQSTQQ